MNASRVTRAGYSLALLLAMFSDVLPTIGPIRLVEVLLPMLLVWILLAERRLLVPRRNAFVPVLCSFVVFIVFIGLVGQLVWQFSLPDFAHGFIPAVRVATYSLFFWIGYHVISREPRYLRTSAGVLAVALSMHAVYAVVQFSALTVGVPSMDLIPYLGSRSHGGGTGFTEAVFSMGGLGMALVAVGIASLYSGYREKVTGWVYTMLGFVAILATMRRATLIGAMAGALSVVLAARSTPPRKMALLALVAVLLSLPFVSSDLIATVSPTLGRRLDAVVALAAGDHSASGLRNLWARVDGPWNRYTQLAARYPLGTGLYPGNIEHDDVTGLGGAADSAYLAHLVWGGPMLLSLYALMLLVPLWQSLRAIRGAHLRTREELMAAYCVTGVIAGQLTAGVIVGGATFALPLQAPYWIVVTWLVAASGFGRKVKAG